MTLWTREIQGNDCHVSKAMNTKQKSYYDATDTVYGGNDSNKAFYLSQGVTNPLDKVRSVGVMQR